MTSLFGTDGVRGRANVQLTPELAVALGRATAQVICPRGGRAIIGRDTRFSGPMLEGALAAGFASQGLDVLLAGIIPTPAISFLIKDERADLGAVISASHNPPADNGIKFFDRRGMKLAVAQEEAIESAITVAVERSSTVGMIQPLEATAARYAAFLTGTIESEEVDLSQHTIVVDCAYGATGEIAPRVLRRLGARVIELHCSHDGARINQGCGSTDLGPLREAVSAEHAVLGIAFDGDGDRVMLVSSSGGTIDGDRMIGIAALDRQRRGTLDPPVVVSTIMSNVGLERTLARFGVALARTPVGDRHVSQAMLDRGAKVGGEPSGHVIFADHSPTGDGILTAVKLLEIAHERDADLADLASEIELLPQVSRSIEVDDAEAMMADETVRAAIDREARLLGDRGRLIVRPSGTQPLIRIMVEGEDPTACEETCDRIGTALADSGSRRG